MEQTIFKNLHILSAVCIKFSQWLSKVIIPTLLGLKGSPINCTLFSFPNRLIFEAGGGEELVVRESKFYFY